MGYKVFLKHTLIKPIVSKHLETISAVSSSPLKVGIPLQSASN